MTRLMMITSMVLWMLTGPAAAAPERYLLQADRSEVGFVFLLNGSGMRGSMPVIAADVVIDVDDFARSHVDVTLDARRARTALVFATQALKGASVLDVASHPTIRFRSTAVRLRDARNLSAGGQIDGQLTIRGVTRPATLSVALFRQSGSAEGDLSQLSFRLGGTIRRSDFGATGHADIVADTITLDIAARVARAQ